MARTARTPGFPPVSRRCPGEQLQSHVAICRSLGAAPVAHCTSLPRLECKTTDQSNPVGPSRAGRYRLRREKFRPAEGSLQRSVRVPKVARFLGWNRHARPSTRALPFPFCGSSSCRHGTRLRQRDGGVAVTPHHRPDRGGSWLVDRGTSGTGVFPQAHRRRCRTPSTGSAQPRRGGACALAELPRHLSSAGGDTVDAGFSPPGPHARDLPARLVRPVRHPSGHGPTQARPRARATLAGDIDASPPCHFPPQPLPRAAVNAS